MATHSVFINVMLAVHEKRTNPLDLYRPLRQYLAYQYSERQAVDNEDDLHLVQQMRNDIERTVDSLDARRDLLQRYYRALCIMESRFPISSEKEDINTVSFTWYDAFKNKKAMQQNIDFEKASILFNLAATQSQLGLNADRSSPNGIKQACSAFQAAAGAFGYLRDNISMKASVGASTVDISAECAGMLERLMLAQAQECFFEKVISDKKPAALCSKVARQVCLYYEETHAALSLPPLSQHFDKAWVAHVNLKAAQFYGEACYRAALDLHEKENIAEEIARLKSAASTLANAKKVSKGVVAPFIDAISKLETIINSTLERAIKENDRVYLMRVPPEASLGPLPGASLVKPTNLSDTLDASKEKMFTALVPDSSAKALSKYTEMLDDVVRTQVEKLQQESEITRVKLNQMGLPESLHALEGSNSLPEQLRNDVESIQLDGGLSGLIAAMGQLQDLKRVNEELLVQTEDLLQKESEEDGRFRSQFGNRWKRQPSNMVTKGFKERLSGFAVKMKQASDMDARIDRTIKDNWEFLAILDTKPIEASLPSLAAPIMSLNGDEDAVAGALKQSLAQLEALGAQRAGLEDALKETKQKDNILPKLMATSGSVDELFKKELTKYDPICLEVSKNVQAQERLLLQIMMQNRAFAAVFNLADFKAACDRVFKQLGAAVLKYREIQDNVHNAGIKFYLSLQDAINSLKQQCTEYVTEREAQNRDMIESLQRQLAGFSFQDNSSSMPYPNINTPQLQRSAPGGPPQTTTNQAASHQAAYQGVHATGAVHPHSLPQPYVGPLPQNTESARYLSHPPPPYYSSLGPSQGVVSSYMATPPPQHGVQQNHGQAPYPGWQAPYYNNTAHTNVPYPPGPPQPPHPQWSHPQHPPLSHSSSYSQPPHSYQPPTSATPAPYYQPSNGNYYR